MRYLLSAAFLVSSTAVAMAAGVAVPEIEAGAGIAAIGAVGAVGALLWERRRR